MQTTTTATTAALTEPLARAIAQDAANRQMRKAGRKAWSRSDYSLACKTLDRIWFAPLAEAEGE